MKSALVLGLVLGLVGLLPLMGGPRYEAALVAGLTGPCWVAIASAWVAHRRTSEVRVQSLADGLRRKLSGREVILSGMLLGVLHALVVLLVALVHGLRTGFCEPFEGFSLLVLGPSFGMVSAGLVGATAGSLAAVLLPAGSRWGRLLAALLAWSVPLASAAIGVLRFYSTPAVYAYDPFVGYFSGPLYDTVAYDISRLLSYRIGTLTSWGAWAILVSQLVFRFEGRTRGLAFVEATRERVAWLVVALALGLVSVLHFTLSEDLQHASSAESIKETLGRTTESGRCRVYFSGGVDSRAATRTAEECEGHLKQLENYFGVEEGGPVDVYLFSSTEEKRILMGAASTYIAKPWRREIYLQPGGFPHQVLGHELAHVVTGQFGAGPLLVAGPLGGIIPDPGRIEGFAVAAAPREDSEGTLHEWTAAMKQLDLLPPLNQLFQLSFLEASAARSYTASGSFVDFIRATYGPESLRKWYSGSDLESLTGKSWQDLETDFHDFLDRVKVPQEVLEIARPRFSRPGIFERKCPHAVDRIVGEAMALCPVQEQKARRRAAEAIALDPQRIDLELSMARCAWYSGDSARSAKELRKKASDEKAYEPGARRAAWDFSGNIAWQQGERALAKEDFEKSMKLTFGRDLRRQLEVKIWALDQEEVVSEALRQLLAPGPTEGGMALATLGSWAGTGPKKDFARYLLSRASMRDGDMARASRWLSAVEVEALPLQSLRHEATRMRVILACQQRMQGGASGALKEALSAYEKLELSGAERLEAKRLSERCETVGLRKRKTSTSVNP